MKKVHLFILIFVIVAVGVVMSLFMNTSTYSNFTKAARHPGKDCQIIGKLDKTKPLVYDAKLNPNEFKFFMIDENEQSVQVVYNGPKPQDFEKPDQLVIKGCMNEDNTFAAKSILMQCPSKYNEKDKPEKFDNKKFS